MRRPRQSGLAQPQLIQNINAPSTAAATFLGADTLTQGNWHGVYGADGYSVFSDVTSYPAYAQVTPTGKADYIWASQPDSDPRALQRGVAAGRIAACWYGSVINIDVNLTDGADHKVTLYLVDWDSPSAPRGSTSSTPAPSRYLPPRTSPRSTTACT